MHHEPPAGKQRGSEGMRGFEDLIPGGPPPLNDGDTKWLASFFRIIFYVGMIFGGAWFLFTWNAKSVKVQSDVTWIMRSAVTRSEWERYVKEENRQRARLWRAIHRPSETEDIDIRDLRRDQEEAQ